MVKQGIQKERLEKSILNSIIAKPDLALVHDLECDWFAFEAVLAKEIFERIKKGEPINATLYAPDPTLIDFKNFAENVRELKRQEWVRRTRAILQDALGDVTMETATEVISSLQGIDLGTKKTSRLSDVMDRAVRQVEVAMDSEEGMTGIPTGFAQLDQMTGGWQDSDLVIVAARPGMGKTALALQFAQRADCLFVSLEMGEVQLAQRILAARTGVQVMRMRKGETDVSELQRLVDATEECASMNFQIYDGGLSVSELRTICHRAVKVDGVKMIVVDYLQMLKKPEGYQAGNYAVEHNSRECKNIAKELNVPVIVLSQLSRAVETRGGLKRPILSDLRDSGAIEQDADLVIFPYRPGYYGFMGQADECIIAKNRNGATGSFEWSWVPELMQYQDLDFNRAPVGFDDPGAGMIRPDVNYTDGPFTDVPF